MTLYQQMKAYVKPDGKRYSLTNLGKLSDFLKFKSPDTVKAWVNNQRIPLFHEDRVREFLEGNK